MHLLNPFLSRDYFLFPPSTAALIPRPRIQTHFSTDSRSRGQGAKARAAESLGCCHSLCLRSPQVIFPPSLQILETAGRGRVAPCAPPWFLTYTGPWGTWSRGGLSSLHMMIFTIPSSASHSMILWCISGGKKPWRIQVFSRWGLQPAKDLSADGSFGSTAITQIITNCYLEPKPTGQSGQEAWDGSSHHLWVSEH